MIIEMQLLINSNFQIRILYFGVTVNYLFCNDFPFFFFGWWYFIVLLSEKCTIMVCVEYKTVYPVM